MRTSRLAVLAGVAALRALARSLVRQLSLSIVQWLMLGDSTAAVQVSR